LPCVNASALRPKSLPFSPVRNGQEGRCACAPHFWYLGLPWCSYRFQRRCRWLCCPAYRRRLRSTVAISTTIMIRVVGTGTMTRAMRFAVWLAAKIETRRNTKTYSGGLGWKSVSGLRVGSNDRETPREASPGAHKSERSAISTCPGYTAPLQMRRSQVRKFLPVAFGCCRRWPLPVCPGMC
jgi:hypothetical protein